MEGMTNGFFVARHLPGVVDLKSTPFPSKPGSKANRDPPLIYCRGLALYVRKAARHLSFQTGGHDARRFSLEMVDPRDDIADIFAYERATTIRSKFICKWRGRD